MINLLKFPKHSTLKFTNRNLASLKDFFGGGNKAEPGDFAEDIAATQKKIAASSDNKTADSNVNKLVRVKSYNPTFKSVEQDIKKLTREVFKQDFDETNYLQLSLSDPLNKYNVTDFKLR